MRKLFGLLVLAALVFGTAGTVLAEGGKIDPFTTKSAKGSVRLMEGGRIDPF